VYLPSSYLLRENGDHIDLDRSWAESFLRRVGYVCRKGTTAARKLPFDFIDNKHEFLKCVEDIIKKWSISAPVLHFSNFVKIVYGE
jgi:hypothetical protein